MKRQLVIPSRNISTDLLLYGQFMRFEILKVTNSVFGHKRFHLKKNHTSFCVEEWDQSSDYALQPYLEVIVSSQHEYNQLLEEITLNSGLQPDMQRYSTEEAFQVVLFQVESVKLKIICSTGENIHQKHGL